MSVRPEPVTSKFRKSYFEQFHPIRISHSNAYDDSSDESTSSLVSILYRIENNNDHISFSDISSDDLDYECNEKIKPKRKSVNNGIRRERIKNDDQTMNNNSNYPMENVASEKSCKRIIARQPEYPGSRVTHIKFGSIVPVVDKQKKIATSRPISANGRIVKQQENTIGKDSGKRPNRKVAQCLEKPTDEKGENDKTEDGYSSNDFESVSIEPAESVKSDAGSQPSEKCNDKKSADDKDYSDHNNDNVPHNAWEAWFMKKEKLRRLKDEEERKKAEKQKEELEKAKLEEEEKEQKRKIKINEWLKKKEEERLKVEKEKKTKDLEKSKEEEKLKEEKQQKLEKKLSNWREKKDQNREDEKKRLKESKMMEESQKMIQKAKAQIAYKEWLEANKNRRPPVPYSYGFSDGKLTSYYDKTSNPAPSFCNPNAWVSPVVEAKQ